MLALAASTLPFAASAQTPKASDQKPFADHHLALQLSDTRKERLVLSVASNFLKFYGPDKIAVEIVAFGSGIDLPKEGNEHRILVDSLVVQGVRFTVCGNTLDTIERETEKRPPVNPHAIEVEAGVAELFSLGERGYTIVRP